MSVVYKSCLRKLAIQHRVTSWPQEAGRVKKPLILWEAEFRCNPFCQKKGKKPPLNPWRLFPDISTHCTIYSVQRNGPKHCIMWFRKRSAKLRLVSFQDLTPRITHDQAFNDKSYTLVTPKTKKNPELPMFYHQSNTDLLHQWTVIKHEEKSLKRQLYPQNTFSELYPIIFFNKVDYARETCAHVVFIQLPF